jgi:hypothetical protein
MAERFTISTHNASLALDSTAYGEVMMQRDDVEEASSSPVSRGRQVVASAFEQLPEEAFVARAVDGLAQLHRPTQDLLPLTVARVHPDVLLLPTTDASGRSMAPLAEGCAQLSADLRVVFLVTLRPGAARSIPSVARRRGTIACVTSWEELREVVMASLDFPDGAMSP